MADPPVIEFFFDIASAYSYLAATQVDALSERTGAVVRWRPFLLGAVLKATGNEMPARVPKKAMYMLADIGRWADEYRIPLVFPKTFPINSLATQRALVAVAEEHPDRVRDFACALFRAYWADGREVTTPEAIAAIANEVGLDGASVAAASSDQRIKDRLREWTDEAVARGAFGSPTFFVGDDLFWGNDRLPHVERRVKG